MVGGGSSSFFTSIYVLDRKKKKMWCRKTLLVELEPFKKLVMGTRADVVGTGLQYEFVRLKRKSFTIDATAIISRKILALTPACMSIFTRQNVP